MIVLLASACTDPKEQPTDDTGEPTVDTPAIVVDADIQGVTVGDMVDGFSVVTTGAEDAWLSVILTTYADPCEKLTGFYEALAAALEPDPNVYYTSEWQAIEADAADEWLPGEAYDTLQVDHHEASEADLVGDYGLDVGTVALGYASVYLQVGRHGYGDYSSFQETDGHAAVSALDPAEGDGAAQVRGLVQGVQVDGQLTFSYRVSACQTYLPALEAFQNAQPDGC